MNFNEENIARFDQFLEGEMSAIERQEFETELMEDDVLKAEFESYQLFVDNLSNAEITLFTQKLKTWDNEGQAPQKQAGRIIALRFFIAAAVAVIGIILATTYFTKSPSNTELIAENFEAYPNVITIRGTAVSIDEGLAYYDQKKYIKAIEIFNSLPQDPTTLFYAGEAYMALEDYEEAIEKFEVLLAIESVFSEVATFHIGLAYLGTQNTEMAIKYMNQLNPSSDYYKQAQLVLSDLK